MRVDIPLDVQFVMVAQMLLAAALGFIIGLDRERKHNDAGLRTHMLVCLGSCLFTGLSINAFPNDPGRVASQILPGIGFLGAGAILKDGFNVQGLTTAASIWLTAAVGMAVGLNAWFLALCATLITWAVLVVIQWTKGRMGLRPLPPPEKFTD